MSTVIIPELSKKNKYWISKHRYYELKHFCLQYPEWKQRVLYLETRNFPGGSFVKTSGDGRSKPTEDIALERLWYNERINLVDKTTEEQIHEIYEMATCGRLELELDAKRFIKELKAKMENFECED